MSAVHRLGEISRTYEALASDYLPLAVDAAEAESAHKRARARHMLTMRADDPKISAAWAAESADADDEVAGLLTARLTTAAVADATRQKLHQLRESVAVGRSVFAAERDSDRVHAGGTGGAA